jgi:Ca-activated chloride channel homolog
VAILPSVLEQNRAFCRDSTISVDVNLVMLHVTARDAKGNFVAGLQKDDFHVFEDGQIQNIRVFQHDDVPVSVGLIVENSGIMRPKRKAVTSAALAFVRSSNPRDETFVVNFNERVSLGLTPDQSFTADAGKLGKDLERRDGALRRNRLWAGSPQKGEPGKKGSHRDQR